MDTRFTIPDTAQGSLLLDIADHIRSHGYSVISVGSGGCAEPGCTCDAGDEQWSYTIGLTERGLPELVVLGLAPRAAHQLVRWGIDELAAAGSVGELAASTSSVAATPLGIRPVPDEWLACDPGRMGLWFRHYAAGRHPLELPAVAQVVWGDQHGRFSDHPLCDPYVAEGQPVLAADPFSFPARVGRTPTGRGRRQFRRR